MTNEILTKRSSQAKHLLLASIPPDSEDHYRAFQLISNRSWKKADAIELARSYLPKGPFAHTFPYQVFFDILGRDDFLKMIDEISEGTENARKDLLDYHVAVVLKNETT